MHGSFGVARGPAQVQNFGVASHTARASHLRSINSALDLAIPNSTHTSVTDKGAEPYPMPRPNNPNGNFRKPAPNLQQRTLNKELRICIVDDLRTSQERARVMI
jgi:hypothetical protein